MIGQDMLHARDDFDRSFESLTGHAPFAWQRRLFMDWFGRGKIPQALDLPTGLGKTSVMAIWHLARQTGALLPRRLVYVVDRRAVVDQATSEAEKLKAALEDGDAGLSVSTLRGQYADNRAWLEAPEAPAIVVGTVDMIGSRLLFSGYGVSRGMRPFHAGLLGADALVVLDESHLVPPFERLLRAVACQRRDDDRGRSLADDRGRSLAAANEADRAPIPPFRLLCLSATGRAEADPEPDREVFRLEAEDREDSVVRQRLDAPKRLTMRDIDGASKPEELAQALADAAWELANAGAVASTFLVYCDRRDVAEKTKNALDKLAGNGGKARKDKGPDVPTELFVGARRVRERSRAEQRLRKLGFLAGDNGRQDQDGPAFLVATSAGEVGIDLDADHMVCDLVAFERLVQRFGRVNRRGGKEAEIRLIVAHGPKPVPKKKDKPTDEEKHKIAVWEAKDAAKGLLKKLPYASGCNGDADDEAFDVSPGSLLNLKERAQDDRCLAKQIKAATTPAPLYPALTRPLVDAWSMTSLEHHSGRPEVNPWLRGWVDDRPQTTVVWRTHLPVRPSGDEDVTESERNAFFRAAPPHLTERLETETDRVSKWLRERAKKIKKMLKSPDAKTDPPDAGEESAETAQCPPLGEETIVALALDNRGAVSKPLRLSDLDTTEGAIQKALSGHAVVVIDKRLGGLSEAGLLDATVDETPPTLDSDSGEPWLDGLVPDFKVQRSQAGEPLPDRTVHSFAMRYSEEGEPTEFLHVQTLALTSETSRSVAANPQGLEDHLAETAEKARALGERLGLPEDYRRVLVLAARLHDEGKRAPCWQRAASAPGDGHVYAKTTGPFRGNELNGYRHEFGSLPYAEGDAEFVALSPELQDLTLHLVAAHHGRARPTIPTLGCEDAPPSVLRERARDVALRFGRLQERWGPWGLAWFETLLRAADQQASRDNDARKGAD